LVQALLRPVQVKSEHLSILTAQQGAAQAEAQATGSLTTFGNAMSSCLEGKGYTVN
jgi:hypothetical protein